MCGLACAALPNTVVDSARAAAAGKVVRVCVYLLIPLLRSSSLHFYLLLPLLLTGGKAKSRMRGDRVRKKAKINFEKLLEAWRTVPSGTPAAAERHVKLGHVSVDFCCGWTTVLLPSELILRLVVNCCRAASGQMGDADDYKMNKHQDPCLSHLSHGLVQVRTVCGPDPEI